MIYSIIFTRHDQRKGLVNWMESNEWNTEEEAYDHAIKMLHKWWNEDPTIVFTIYKHAMIWKAQSRYSNEKD